VLKLRPTGFPQFWNRPKLGRLDTEAFLHILFERASLGRFGSRVVLRTWLTRWPQKCIALARRWASQRHASQRHASEVWIGWKAGEPHWRKHFWPPELYWVVHLVWTLLLWVDSDLKTRNGSFTVEQSNFGSSDSRIVTYDTLIKMTLRAL
jgi:hypothetical protein